MLHQDSFTTKKLQAKFEKEFFILSFLYHGTKTYRNPSLQQNTLMQVLLFGSILH